jgi:hypothetical protein
MKLVLIVHEKHGTRIFDASTDELLAKASIKIIAERLALYEPLKPQPIDVLTEEQIAALPERLQENERDRLRRSKVDLAYYKEDLLFYAEAKRIVEERDLGVHAKSTLPIAYRILRSRWCEGHEYEEVQLEELESVL